MADEDAGACVLDDGTGLLRVQLRAFLRNAPPDAVGAHPAVGACDLNLRFRIGSDGRRVVDDDLRGAAARQETT